MMPFSWKPALLTFQIKTGLYCKPNIVYQQIHISPIRLIRFWQKQRVCYKKIITSFYLVCNLCRCNIKLIYIHSICEMQNVILNMTLEEVAIKNTKFIAQSIVILGIWYSEIYLILLENRLRFFLLVEEKKQRTILLKNTNVRLKQQQISWQKNIFLLMKVYFSLYLQQVAACDLLSQLHLLHVLNLINS